VPAPVRDRDLDEGGQELGRCLLVTRRLHWGVQGAAAADRAAAAPAAAQSALRATEALRCRELTRCFLPDHSALGVDASQVRHVATL
jgi:hypothetical protein